ncbi:ATP-dependent helicase [Candidatus Wolfebacteria bacterium]|nr:ATP-dependent helicase [Candidatus Wolfebacteria bacterium]
MHAIERGEPIKGADTAYDSMKIADKVLNRFEQAYARLNDEQRRAVDTIDGPVMVIAGPGTGKTEVLTMRIANIIYRTDTPPGAVLALTFTESAVASMRKRLVDLIGAPGYDVLITTFHSFANSVIGRYPDKFPEIIGSTSITDVDQVRLVQDIIDTTPLTTLKPFGDRYYYLKSILAAINELKRQGISPAAFKEIAEREKSAWGSTRDLYYASGAHAGKMKGRYKDELAHIERNLELVTLYQKYEDELRAEKRYDYGDMIFYVMLALERDEDLRLSLQETYLYFLVDEHQDTNDAQNRIIELLASFHENPNIFVVGDEKQAIFRFQGASIANFFHFKKLYTNAALISLRDNYRGTQAILDAADAISPRETNLIARAGHPEAAISLAALRSPDAECFFISEKVRALTAAGVTPEEIAILYRDNRDAIPIARMLEKQNIQFAIESDQDVLGDEDIEKLLRIITAVRHFGAKEALAPFLHVDFFDIPPLDIYKLFSYATAQGHMNPYDVMKSEKILDDAGIEKKERFIDLFHKLSAWRHDAENRGALEVFENIVRDSGFLASIENHPAASEKIAKLHALFEHLKALVEDKKNYRFNEFFDYLELVREHDVPIKASAAFLLPGRIHLMTAHKSKGQEFEYVIIAGAVAGKWGSRRRPEHIKLPRGMYRTLAAIEDVFEDSDERNLFYVALTRAKKEVFITYSATNREGRDHVPSQFTKEIREDLLMILDTSADEENFASHRNIEFRPRLTTQPDIKDKEFLNALYGRQGLSVTALDNYLECPWKYFYVNLIRIPEMPTKHLMFGTAVHEAVKNYFTLRARGDDRGVEYLIRRFEEELRRQPIEQSDFDESLQKGKNALRGWWDAHHDRWISNVVNERRFAGIELEPGTLITGRIDKIEILDGKRSVNVVDYKTGKPKSRNAIEGKTRNSDGDYKRQLVFYKLLLDKDGSYEMASGEIDFIEPDDRGKFHKERFDIDAEEVKGLEQKVIDVSREIRSMAFWDKVCDDTECTYCALRKSLR